MPFVVLPAQKSFWKAFQPSRLFIKYDSSHTNGRKVKTYFWKMKNCFQLLVTHRAKQRFHNCTLYFYHFSRFNHDHFSYQLNHFMWNESMFYLLKLTNYSHCDKIVHAFLPWKSNVLGLRKSFWDCMLVDINHMTLFLVSLILDIKGN